VADHYGTIDILVNNAGTSWGAAAEEHPIDAWNRVMNLNATGVFMLSQAVANRCFIPRRSGNIIVIASTAALRAGMQMKAVAYYSSKAAALHLTPRARRRMGTVRHSRQPRFARAFSRRK